MLLIQAYRALGRHERIYQERRMWTTVTITSFSFHFVFRTWTRPWSYPCKLQPYPNTEKFELSNIGSDLDT